ncbi:MAG: hypothetical protein HY774_11445 [Acidobacteria bacterium]|nr:hypothetical protein [Acidobacteriota bacterium]
MNQTTLRHTLSWPETLRDIPANPAMDVALINFIREAARLIDPLFSPPAVRSDQSESTVRDDNGGYFWEGKYREGDARHAILVSYFGDQPEEMMYPQRRSEQRTCTVVGLPEPFQLKLDCDYATFAGSISWIYLKLEVTGDTRLVESVQQAFVDEFEPKSPTGSPENG